VDKILHTYVEKPYFFKKPRKTDLTDKFEKIEKPDKLKNRVVFLTSG